MGKLTAKIQEEVDGRSKELLDLRHEIHANPELGYKEEKASKWLAHYLDGNGFKVERGVADLSIAFKANTGIKKENEKEAKNDWNRVKEGVDR